MIGRAPKLGWSRPRAVEDQGGDPRSSELANPILRRWVDLLYELKPLAQLVLAGHMLVIEASNAQRNQSHRADTDNEHQQCYRIIIEPVSTRSTSTMISSVGGMERPNQPDRT